MINFKQGPAKITDKNSSCEAKCFCEGCPRYEERYKELFINCDSIFDAAVDMQIFIAECLPTCKKRLDNPVI